jgi:hypothetical protein
MDLIYVVGCPGAGKTTLVRELTKNCLRYEVKRNPVYEALLNKTGDVVALEVGKRKGTFSGTDALPMDVHPKAVEWIGHAPFPLVLGEGMRLGTTGFLAAAREVGYNVHLIYLHAPQELAAQRRAARGTSQSESWIKGAATRAENLYHHAQQMRFDVILLSAAKSPSEIADDARIAVPALEVLK